MVETRPDTRFRYQEMRSVKKLMADEPEVAAFKLAVDSAIQKLNPKRVGERRGELHVSSFTASGVSFCARGVVLHWWRGGTSEFTTLVQRDGKFRENKWNEIFESAGIIIAYQPLLRLGRLEGHPDWILDWGYGPRIIDLTGQDPTMDPIFRSRHVGMKKRQVMMYNIMGDFARGYALVENKATCEFRVIPVNRDSDEERVLVERVALVTSAVDSLSLDSTDEEVAQVVSRLPSCGSTRCSVCQTRSS